MNEYHKIPNVFKRDMESPDKKLINGDFTRPEFEYLAQNDWVFTEKVDGTNIRVMVADGKITFGGRTDNANLHGHLVQRLQERFLPQQDALIEAFPDGVCFYGEGYGAGIQKAGVNYRPDKDFVLFDVKVGDWWLTRESVEEIAATFGLDVVPVVKHGSLYEGIALITRGLKSYWGDFMAEGVIGKPVMDLKARDGSRIVVKLKHCDLYEGGV